jgi:hypothetical protein
MRILSHYTGFVQTPPVSPQELVLREIYLVILVTTESRVAWRLLYMRGIDRLQLLQDDIQFPEAVDKREREG